MKASSRRVHLVTAHRDVVASLLWSSAPFPSAYSNTGFRAIKPNRSGRHIHLVVQNLTMLSACGYSDNSVIDVNIVSPYDIIASARVSVSEEAACAAMTPTSSAYFIAGN